MGLLNNCQKRKPITVVSKWDKGIKKFDHNRIFNDWIDTEEETTRHKFGYLYEGWLVRYNNVHYIWEKYVKNN